MKDTLDRRLALPFALAVTAAAAAATAVGGCSALLDFKDINGLPCPCDESHVCLGPSDTCVPRHSVDLFKSCDLGADKPDDLCPTGAICERVNGSGKRCLPTCTPSNYATPEAGANLAAQCPSGTTCWNTERNVGVCAEGVCNDIPNDCTPPQQCVRFNGAGICFTPCQVFEGSPLPCAGTQICQPIGASSVTACVNSGTRQLNDPCDDVNMCAQVDQTPRQRRMACDRPATLSSATEIRRCHAICVCYADGSCDNSPCNTQAPCVMARPNVDPTRGLGLGLCLE